MFDYDSEYNGPDVCHSNKYQCCFDGFSEGLKRVKIAFYTEKVIQRT